VKAERFAAWPTLNAKVVPSIELTALHWIAPFRHNIESAQVRQCGAKENTQ
jgi:hypothetical protein